MFLTRSQIHQGFQQPAAMTLNPALVQEETMKNNSYFVSRRFQQRAASGGLSHDAKVGHLLNNSGSVLAFQFRPNAVSKPLNTDH